MHIPIYPTPKKRSPYSAAALSATGPENGCPFAHPEATSHTFHTLHMQDLGNYRLENREPYLHYKLCKNKPRQNSVSTRLTEQ